VFKRSSKRLANFQQTSSKRSAIHVYLEYICWKFAGRLLDRLNNLLQKGLQDIQNCQDKTRHLEHGCL